MDGSGVDTSGGLGRGAYDLILLTLASERV